MGGNGDLVGGLEDLERESCSRGEQETEHLAETLMAIRVGGSAAVF